MVSFCHYKDGRIGESAVGRMTTRLKKRGGGRRRLDVDGMRLLAACFVLMYHFRLFPLNHEAPSSMNLYVRSAISCCVPIFFFLTGILYSRRRISFQNSLNKAIRLFCLTLVWALILWPIRALQGGLEVRLNMYVAGVLTLQQGIINYLWFLPALAIVYLLLPFFCIIANEDRRLLGRIAFATCLFTFGLDAFQRVGEVFDWVFDTQILLKGVSFLNKFNPLRGVHGFSIAFCLVGMVWEDIEEALSRKSALVCLVMAPLLLAGYSAFRMQATHEAYDPTWHGYSCVSTLIVVACLFSIVSKLLSHINPDSVFAELINYIGGNSFGVYLLHHPLLGPTIGAAASIAGKLGMGMVAGPPLCVISLTVLAFVSEVLARTKVGKWLLSV